MSTTTRSRITPPVDPGPMSTAPAPYPIDETQIAGSSSSAAITAVGVRKSFGDNVVLDGVELTVERGSVFALLGPNGAGKTTMVRILATLLEPDHGEIRVAGHDVAREPDAVRDAIGVTGQFSAVDELLTGRENLALMADLHHLARDDARRRIGELLERFELVEAADRMVATYSGGMRRRLDLAMTLMGAPQVIFLDEPTTGLDPRSRRTMWEIVHNLVGDGTTVFLTTQYLEEADRLADRVAILDRGRIVAQGTARELKQRIPGGRIDLSFADAAARLSAATALELPVRDDEALTLQIPTDGNVATLRRVLRDLDEAGVDVDGLAIHTPDLDDVFFALTGRQDHARNPEAKRSRLMTGTYALRDSSTMLRRNLRHLQRYPGLSLFPILGPVVFLLLFVYVFGGTLGNGITTGGGRGAYVNFLTPGILLFTVLGAANTTAISVAKDMTEGIIARFKTMRIWRPAVLAGHVLGSLILTLISLAVVIAVALLIGYHASVSPLRWLAALGLLVLLAIALIWLTVAFGLNAKSVETASNMPMFLILLPFLSSAFVPVASMPAGLRWFAENQPFTPITNTLRRLLANQHVGGVGITAVVWCLVITAAAYLWARYLYNRREAR